MDLDHFKRVNDEHGHLMGDAVLQTVTDRIASMLRSEDCLARWGGEEFAVLAPDINRDGVLALAERAREALAEEPIQVGEVSLAHPLRRGSPRHRRAAHPGRTGPRRRSGPLRGEGRGSKLRADPGQRRRVHRRQWTVMVPRPFPSRS
jgi:GGDEF domain-containing protein